MKSNHNLLPATPRDIRSAARPPILTSILTSILTASIATLLGVAPLHAQDKWIGTTDGVWNTNTNWLDGSAPAVGTDVQFFGGYDGGGVGYGDPANPSATNDVVTFTLTGPSGTHTGGIQIDSLTSYTINSGAGLFSLGSGKSVVVFSGSHTINENIRFDGNGTTADFNIGTGATLTVSDLDANAHALRKSGAGTLIYNDSTGITNGTGMDVAGGTVDLRFNYSSGSIDPGSGTAMLTGVAGTTVTKSTAGLVTLSVGTTSSTATVGENTGTYAGAITDNLNFTVNRGTQTLTGLNTYTGATTVNLATLVVDMATNDTNVLTTGTALTLGGGTLNIKGKTGAFTSAQTVGDLTLSGTNTLNTISVDANGGNATTLTLGNTWTRGAGTVLNFNLTGASTITSNPSGLAVNGVVGFATVTDSGGIWLASLSGGNIVRLTGQTSLANNSNSATTNFSVGNGTLTMGGGNIAVNSLTIDTSAGTGVLDLAAGTMAGTAQALVLSGSSDYTVQNGTIDLGASGTFNVFQGGGGILNLNASLTGAAGLTKATAGTLVLGGIGTYTGGTNVLLGTLRLNHQSAAAKSFITLATGTSLTFGPASTAYTIGGISTSNNLSLLNTGAQAVTLTIDSASNSTLSGVISGAGSNLAISGGGTATISNTGNTFGGSSNTITVSGGSTLSLGSLQNPAGALGNATNKLVLNGGTLTNNAGQDSSGSLANPIEFQAGGTNTISTPTTSNRGFFFSGALSGSGGFTTSAGASYIALLNITGNITLAGTVRVQTGALMIASDSSRDALAGAGLDLAGGNAIFTGSTGNAGAIPNFNRSITVSGNASLSAGAGYTFTQTGTLTGSSTLSINTTRPGMTGTAALANQLIDVGSTSVVVLNGNASAFTGGLTVSIGTLRIGTSATLPSTFGLMTITPATGVLDLNNRDVTVRGLVSTTAATVQGNASGSAKTLTINTTGNDRSFAGTIVNGGGTALNLTKIGTNTQTLTGANTYTGTTTINGGTLATTTGTTAAARIQGGGALALGGGILSVTGSTTAATNVTQSFSGTTLNAGFSGVTNANGAGGGTSTVALGAITRNTGSQVNFTLTSGSITSTTANTAGILGGWAIVGDNFAASAGDGVNPGAISTINGLNQNGSNSALLGTVGFDGNVNYSAAPTGTVTDGAVVNSIRMGFAGTVTLAGTLTVTSGGILNPSTGGAATFTGGILRGTAATGLNLFNRAGSSDLRITSVIADNGGPTALTITGASFVVLTGTTVNTYSGETYVSGAATRLRLGGGSGAGGNGSNANLGDQTVGAALNINGGSLFYDGNFALDNAGSNKRNVVIGSTGAIFRPVSTASTDALTISGVISGSDFGLLTLGGNTNAFDGNLICRVANKSRKQRAIKSGKFSLIMKGLERGRVEKDNRKSVL